jgi:DnaJ-class molecular chaperone
MAITRPAYSKLRAQMNEKKYERKIDDIMHDQAYKMSSRLTEEERNATLLRRRLALKVRTTTDVGWCTITTADAGMNTTQENAQREKLKSLWFDGFKTQYPEGTEWTIVNEYW